MGSIPTTAPNFLCHNYTFCIDCIRWNLAEGLWCSGITSASHAEGPGFKSQQVHFFYSNFRNLERKSGSIGAAKMDSSAKRSGAVVSVLGS